MDAEEARYIDAVLRRLGLPGVVAPEDPDNPAGPWRVYDQADPDSRTDMTARTLVSVTKALGADASPPAPKAQRNGPSRGFIIPPND
ncbi:hypothetical protein [Streptomyces sp. ST2-7A]|uniref:hypothetical protein n=1 Tax=Streptomyces sp. ST2-7A TaxID=2907214 RepID=UPI001F20273F|nr:hypothetical protein [Streptomyces sp. ST2-7A]MCE7082778.1 hypothetical protein [Streptomyces sp. ST2-7A]